MQVTTTVQITNTNMNNSKKLNIIKGHRRNLSNLSNITTASELFDPLLREGGAELRIVLLFDSLTESTCVYNVLRNTLISNGNSARIKDAKVINQALWDEKSTNISEDCLKSLDLALSSSKSTHFKFTIDSQVFRVALINKDRRSILKTMPYDFLAVCMKLRSIGGEKRGTLEKDIWQHEWKWIQKVHHGNTPVFLIGYLHNQRSSEIYR